MYNLVLYVIKKIQHYCKMLIRGWQRWWWSVKLFKIFPISVDVKKKKVWNETLSLVQRCTVLFIKNKCEMPIVGRIRSQKLKI